MQQEPQNIYDNLTFFEGYKNLRQNDSGLNGVLEIPAIRRLMPDLAGLHILDLGCGFGDFARFARNEGAASVTAVDVSQRMLEEAMRHTADSAVTYLHTPIEKYISAPGMFDLVVSSLALHYIADYSAVVRNIFRFLKPNGKLVFSVEHPMCTANPVGWVSNENGEPVHWPVDHYQQEGARETQWFVDGVIKYHRTTQTYINALIAAGFRLDHFGEPMPAAEILASRPELQTDCRRPPFLLLAATALRE